MKFTKAKRVISIILTIFMLAGLMSGCGSLFGSGDKTLVINEVVTSNKTTLTDGDGDSSDWIEIYNCSDKDIDIGGYYLSDSLYDAAKWQFPQGIKIKAGEYLIVFASGKDKVEDDGYTCHTNFKLSSKGENVVLSTGSISSIDSVSVPELAQDVSYGRVQDGGENDGEYGIMISATPGARNGGKRAEAEQGGENTGEAGSGEIVINEYMSRNSYICYDSDGDYSDWVELYNTTDTAISLAGYGLSTEDGNLQKWTFPNVTIEAGGYLTVWLSGKNKVTESGELHANFKLGQNDKILILSTGSGAAVDSAAVYSLPENVSYGRSAEDRNKWVYYAKPTPGKANTTQGYDDLGTAVSLKAKGLWVSEVSSVSLPYNDKQQSDWIEIYNGTGESVNLKGYGLSKDALDKYNYTFGDRTIAAGEYLVIYATGENVPSNFASRLHTDFKLSAKGDTVYLTDPEGYIIDAFETGRLSDGYTSGRAGTEEAVRYFFMEETPGAANSSEKYASYTAKPEISSEGGYVNSGTVITVSAPQNAELYYTTDGSEPNINSQKYTGGITLTENTTIKVKAIEQGYLPSDTVVSSFIVGKTHSIPVVCISGDPDDLFGYNNGILANGPGYKDPFPYTGANFWKDWERKVTFEYYDENGEKQVEFIAGAKIFGQYSRAYDQKSISIHMRGDYGLGSITYPFFKDNSITTMSNVILRAGGQDQKFARIRDSFAAQVMKGQTTLALMDWQPVVLYINGEYWGFYEMREKINESYLESHYGIDPDNVDIIKGNRNVLSGTYDNYGELMSYVKSHDLSKSEYYEVVENWVDIDNYIDYLIAEIYFCNGDTGNVKFYRERKEGAKWQWVLFDMDMTLRSDSVTGQTNSIKNLFNPGGHGSGNAFETTLQCALLKNSEFKNKFIERYAYHLNNTFMPERMNSILDSMVAQIDGEMDMHCQKWGKPESYSRWQSEVAGLKSIINRRRAQAMKEMKAYFGLSDARMAELFPNG